MKEIWVVVGGTSKNFLYVSTISLRSQHKCHLILRHYLLTTWQHHRDRGATNPIPVEQDRDLFRVLHFFSAESGQPAVLREAFPGGAGGCVIDAEVTPAFRAGYLLAGLLSVRRARARDQLLFEPNSLRGLTGLRMKQFAVHSVKIYWMVVTRSMQGKLFQV